MVCPQLAQNRASSGIRLPQFVQKAMQVCDPLKSKRKRVAKSSRPKTTVYRDAFELSRSTR